MIKSLYAWLQPTGTKFFMIQAKQKGVHNSSQVIIVDFEILGLSQPEVFIILT